MTLEQQTVTVTVTVEEKKDRLRGRVQIWLMKKGRYGFIVSDVMDENTGRLKQWHFHWSSVRTPRSIAVGVLVEFTPVPMPPGCDKCDKASDVEVVG